MRFAVWLDWKDSDPVAKVVARLSGFLAGGRRWLFASAVLVSAAAQAQSGPILTFSTPNSIGVPSPAATVTVTAQQPGVVSRVQVLTGGAAGLEFNDAGGACATQSFTSAGQTCTESVTFTPAYPGLRLGAVVLLDSSNAALGTAFLSGTGLGGLGIFVPGNLVDVAGGNGWKSALNGPALSASFYLPTSVAFDGAGNMYVADSLHNQIRKVDATQNVSTVAGAIAAGYSGDGGPAASATLSTPSGLAVDGAGNLYIADTGNNVIREIVQATGIIVTVAGAGSSGNGGDGGPATAASLDQPLGVTVDTAGNLYIADTGNNRIRRVDAASGAITHVAGDPGGASGYSGDNGAAASAQLNGPDTVAFDAYGDMYIPDSLNNVVRMVDTSGNISTFAGGGPSPIDYGPANTAQLSSPSAVVVDPAQNVYIADTQNNAIRKVFAGSGYLITVAELGAGGGFFSGNGYSEGLYGPAGMAQDGKGNLYFADALNNKIRAIQSNQVVEDFTETPTYLGQTSATQSQYLENDGNAALTVESILPDANAAIDSTVQYACVANTQYAPVNGCNIGVQFKPVAAVFPLQANIAVATDSVNAPFDIELVGFSEAQNSSSIELTSGPNPSISGQNIVFTAKVANGGASAAPTGIVNFTADGASIGSATLDSTGSATFNDSALPVGNHSIAASYLGDAANTASASSTLSQVVQLIPTQTVLGVTSSGSASTPALLMATVATSAGSTPTGTVTFVNGTAVLGTAPLNANAVSTLQTTLTAGSYAIVANYSGDATHAPSSSTVVTVSGSAGGFTLISTPAAMKIVTGKSATATLNLTSVSGFADTIGLGCASLPVLVSCHFSSDNIALAAGGSASVQLTIETNTPFGDGSSAMNKARTPASIAFAGLFLPVALLFGLVAWRFRKRHALLFPLALGLVASGAFLISGCNNIDPARATPGDYTVQITGVGVKTNALQSQALTLTITQ